MGARKRFLNLLSKRFNASRVWWQYVRDIDEDLPGEMRFSRRAQGID
jgi:hypothetical protein